MIYFLIPSSDCHFRKWTTNCAGNRSSEWGLRYVQNARVVEWICGISYWWKPIWCRYQRSWNRNQRYLILHYFILLSRSSLEPLISLDLVGLPIQRTSYQSSPTFLCFESPIGLFASQHNVFRTMWSDRYKGPITNPSKAKLQQTRVAFEAQFKTHPIVCV